MVIIFTWTLEETKAALSEEEAAGRDFVLRHSGSCDMHHNPAKNVFYVANSLEQIARRLSIPERTGASIAGGG